MRVLLIGDKGTIGSTVRATLEARGHEVVGASRKDHTHPVDITDAESVERLFHSVGAVDAVACAGGHVKYGTISSLSYSDYRSSLGDKALGQIELVRRGLQYLNGRGSFTLITGVLATYPVVTASAAAAANGAVEAFVRAAALEVPPLRINAVSPTLLAESVGKAGHMFPGVEPVTAKQVANAYVRSIEGAETGMIYRLFDGS
ncbi:short chain dehydrogenase [Arthrobacter pascens]|uniref:short chain dehydrogenase n=1 Tax=Arthrobacter pascens TaxID=1677 RepID=UPI00196A9482|nr:short chain dehydrogenase [Arthrobacter pascens]MBN3497888.1 short chain dehydrogenase [Arthrobacter pascens]